MARKKKEPGELKQVHNYWSSEETEKLIELFKQGKKVSEIAVELERAHHSVYNKLRTLGMTKQLKGRHWTEDEDAYLDEAWGVYKVMSIAKKLNRTEESVLRRAKELGLGRYIDGSGRFITPAEIIEGMGITRSILTTWRKHGLNVRTISTEAKGRNIKYLGISWVELLDWLENNQDRWDSIKTKDYFFVEKPDWMREKFRQDKLMANEVKVGSKWTSDQKNTAKLMYMRGYSFEEIGEHFNRSTVSAKNIIYKSNVKVCRASRPWTYKETEKIKQMSDNMTTQEIADELGRSYSAILNKQKRLGLKTSKNRGITNEMEMVNYVVTS